MTDYGALRAEWEGLLGRRSELRGSLAFWTPILDGWMQWRPAKLPALAWGPAQCRDRWERGVPLLAEAPPEIAREPLEDLLGPLIERLAVAGPDEMAALGSFAGAWDAGTAGPDDLFPSSGKDGASGWQERLGVPARLLAFLAHAGLRPALEAYFAAVRGLPDGVWAGGGCPWCGGPPAYGDLIEEGRRRLSCHLCGGLWPAHGSRCPFCAGSQWGEAVRLLDGEMEEGYFMEGCPTCHGYLKGVDRRRRTAGSPVVEDWGSPHLDLHAARQGYTRATPSLAHLVP